MAETSVDTMNDPFEEPLTALGDDNKFVRRKALNDMKKLVQQDQDFESAQLAKKLVKHMMQESMESCRQLITEILSLLIERDVARTVDFTEIVKTVCKILPSEASEELRLHYLKLVTNLLTRMSKDALKLCLDTAFTGLILALKDGYPEVVKEGCRAVCVFGKRYPELFQLQCKSFVTHLAAGLKHRQGNVRVSCLEALGAVTVFGSELLIPQLSAHLKQEMSDNNPYIRQAAVTAAAESIHRPDTDDRYNQLLLPVLLIGTCDDFPEVCHKAQQQLSRVEKMSLGQALNSILETVRQDAEDWNPEVKLNAAKLLYATLQHFQETVQPKIRDILILLLFQSGDDDAGKASSQLGAICCPAALDEFRNVLNEDEKTGQAHLLVFSSLVLGVKDESTLKSCAENTVEILSILSEVLRDSESSTKLTRCCPSLINALNTENGEVVKKLATVLLNLGAASFNSKDKTCFDLIQQLAARNGFHSAADYFCKHTDLFRLDSKDISSWTADSMDWKKVLFLVEHWELVEIPFISSIFPSLLSISTSPELRLKTFSILASKLKNLETSDFWKDYFLHEIVPHLRENLHWKPGNAAAILRSAATVCWCESFEAGILPAGEFTSAPLLSLIEDEETRTRGVVTSTLSRLLNEVDEKDWIPLTTALIGRLDDVNRQVRIAAVRSLTSNFLSLSRDFNFEKLLDRFLELAILLMDDADGPTAAEARSALNRMAEKYPEKVKGQLMKTKSVKSLQNLLETLNL